METALLACRCIDSKPPSSVEALRFSPDGRWLAVGRSSGIVEIFSSVSRHLKLRLEEASCSSVRNILWLPLTVAAVEAAVVSEAGGVSIDDGGNNASFVSLFEWRIITAGLHGMINSWNLRTCHVQVECPSYGGAIFSLCRSPPELGLPAFAAACDDGRVRLFRLAGSAERACREVNDEPYAGMIQSDSSNEEITLMHTLPKTKARLLSVCWYSPHLVFAGNAESCILRFSRAGPQQTFVADGKMVLESQPVTGTSVDGTATLVWNLRALPRRSLLVSGDSRGRVTLWSLPACVALRSLQVHVADVLDMEVMVCVDSFLGTKLKDGAPVVKMQQEVIFSVGVDGKLSAISRTEEDRWVVRACRFPHLCDTQALACLPRIPGGQDASLVVTGAADGSIKYMQQLTELAGLKVPCLPLCASPALNGLQKPRVLWKKRLIVGPSDDDVGIWHIEDNALQEHSAEIKEPSAPLIRLARIVLQQGTKIKCCDVTRDGQLVAIGSNNGLHLFAFHLKELEIQDVECIGSCCISEMVTALQFVSRTMVACCHFSKKLRKPGNFRRLRSVADRLSSSNAGSRSSTDKKAKGRTESHEAAETSSASRRWIYSDVPSVRETEALPDELLKDDGSFCLSFLTVSSGQEVASVAGLPFPIILMARSPDLRKLACLNSNGSILVVDTESFQVTHFFPNIFRRGESVASFCFAPDSTRLFVLGTRNGYYIAVVEGSGGSTGHDQDVVCDGQTGAPNAECPRKRHRRQSQRNVRSIPAKHLSRGDGCIVDCKWVEATNGESYVLCLLPSCLYKISIVDIDDSGDIYSRFRKRERQDIRLLDVSSASEGERDDSLEASQPSSFSRRLKRLSTRRPVIIGPTPVHATAFCVPRVLPRSLVTDHQDVSSSSWTPAKCLSPSRTASTRSTATTPGDSPVSDGRGGDANSLSKGNPNSASRAIQYSENKGFIGFAFENCAKVSAPPGLSDTAVDHALILVEALNGRAPSEPPLPRFSRKRYGT